jgi:putative peptidoglycan lipid II flippase
VLGLVKLHLLSGLLQTASDKDLNDAFGAAFKLPDLIFNILVMGALNAAFVPVFGHFVAKGEKEKAWHTAVSLVNISMVFFAIASVFVFIFAEPFVKLLAPGYAGEKLALTANLTRVMMLSPIFLGVSAFLSGGINAFHRFIVPAMAPILYNVGFIAGILWLYPRYGVYGLAYGVIIGSILHLAIQLPLAHHLGFRYRFILDWKDDAVRQVSRLMVPRTVGLGIDQIESVVATMLASLLGTGSFTLFSRAYTLITFPITFFGVSFAQAALPTLSQEAARGQIDSFRQTLLDTFHQILFLTVPFAVLMIVLRVPITRLVFSFPLWEDTLVVKDVLIFFALGLAAQAGIHIFVRGLYALQDTIHPLYAGSAGVIASVATSLILLQSLGLKGIALGVSIGSFVNLFCLIVFIQRKIGGLGWNNLFVPALRILFSGAVMAAAVYFPVKPLDQNSIFDTSHTPDLITLSVLVTGFGGALYLFVAWILGSEEITMFLKLAQKLRSWREAFVRFTDREELESSTQVAEQVTGKDAAVGS